MRIGDKKPIYQVEALAEELQLVVVIQGEIYVLRLWTSILLALLCCLIWKYFVQLKNYFAIISGWSTRSVFN